MNRKKIILIVGVIALLIILGCLGFFIILPMMVLGPEPTSIFCIGNRDNASHIVSIEVFNSDNKSIDIISYDVQPDDFMCIDRGFDWCPKHLFYWLYWDEGSYTFNVTLDNTYNVWYHEDLNPHVTIWITVNFDDEYPLDVGTVSA